MMRKKHKRNGCIIACHRLIHNVIKMSFSHPQRGVKNKKRASKKKEAFPSVNGLRWGRSEDKKKLNSEMEFKYHFHFNTFLLCHTFSNFLKNWKQHRKKRYIYMIIAVEREFVLLSFKHTFIHDSMSKDSSLESKNLFFFPLNLLLPFNLYYFYYRKKYISQKTYW